MNLPAIDEFEDTDLFFPDGDCVSDVEEESGYKAFNTDDTNVSSENKMGDIAAFRRSIDIDCKSNGRGSHVHFLAQGFFEEDEVSHHTTTTQPSCARNALNSHAMANSMPARLHHVKMGSSVPMNIPMYTRFNEKLVSPGANLGMAPGNVDDDLPFKAPFIPPHEMSQGMATTQAFALSLSNGESLSDMKRKRLRERTAILRLTGFLEDRSMDVGSPQGGSSNSTAVHVERTLVSGCLSKALVAMV